VAVRGVEDARERMVKWHLEGRGITDARVLAAFRRVPRELFVPPELAEAAYDDCPLPIGEGQTISQPYIVALMTEALALNGGERVLEVGTGSGYQTAILAEMGCQVYTVERILSLLLRALDLLSRLGYAVNGRAGDGTLGWQEHAPYDAIIVTAAGPAIPPCLLDQLAEGGRLVMPVGDRFSQELIRVVKVSGTVRSESLGGCQFVPLIGACGWKE